MTPQPSNSTAVILINFFFFLGCFAYLYGIVKASLLCWPKGPIGSLPPVLSSVTTSIAAVFATNLGALIGYLKLKVAGNNLLDPVTVFTRDPVHHGQEIACYVYAFGLLLAVIVWAKKNFSDSDQEVCPLLSQLSKSLIGVIIGCMAIGLNVPAS